MRIDAQCMAPARQILNGYRHTRKKGNLVNYRHAPLFQEE